MNYRQLNRIKGAGTSLITPFSADGSVDTGALSRIIEASFEGGMDFLCLLGPASEADSLSKEERALVRNTVVSAAAGRFPLLMGLESGISVSKVSLMPESAWDGIDALLVRQPEGADAYCYFRDMAQASPLPLFLLSDGAGIPSETLLRLAAECPGIVGIVISSGDGVHIREILENRPDGFALLSGDDMLTCELVVNGADGAVSVAANAMPESEWLLVHSFAPEVAMNADMLIRPYVELFGKESTEAGIKMMLSKMGIAENILRAPLSPASEQLQFEFNLLMK